DFGLVKEYHVDQDLTLTGANTVLGTPAYMAPESILPPHAADARSDLYAVGAVAFYLLAGSDVFSGASILDICTKHLHQTPQPLSARGIAVPADLEALVLSCLSKDPDQRPQSAADLRRQLDACAVELWDTDVARAWWHARQPAFATDDAAVSSSEAMTMAVGAR